MTDAEKREKVIRGIEYCLLRSQEKVHCGDCPYWYDDFESGCHVYDMMRDALALLKEQEPRMLTESEAKQYTNGEEKYEYSDKPPLYIEHKKAQPFYIKWATLEVVGAWMKDLNMKQEYGKTFRFWTSRPSPEQMRDTPWEMTENG